MHPYSHHSPDPYPPHKSRNPHHLKILEHRTYEKECPHEPDPIMPNCKSSWRDVAILQLYAYGYTLKDISSLSGLPLLAIAKIIGPHTRRELIKIYSQSNLRTTTRRQTRSSGKLAS